MQHKLIYSKGVPSNIEKKKKSKEKFKPLDTLSSLHMVNNHSGNRMDN